MVYAWFFTFMLSEFADGIKCIDFPICFLTDNKSFDGHVLNDWYAHMQVKVCNRPSARI